LHRFRTVAVVAWQLSQTQVVRSVVVVVLIVGSPSSLMHRRR
jgi:hypothetical protein